MTTTSVDDAIILPQSQGTGLGGEESVIDAAINGVLNRYVGGEYVASEYSTGLAFQNHNASNDTVEVGPGIVFVQDNSTSTSGERGSGGNPQAESSTTSGYDTELPEGHTYAVLLPTATEISVSNSTLNEVYVDIDDVTANNSVNIEHDGSSTASPGNTSLKIGETNPDDASADTRANDDASPTYDSLTVNGTTDTDALNAENTIVRNQERFVEDDYELITAYGLDGLDLTFTNTSKAILTSGSEEALIDFDKIDFSSYKGVYASFSFERLGNDTAGETTSVNLLGANRNDKSFTTTEVTTTGSNRFNVLSDREEISDTSGSLRFRIEGSVTGGTGSIRGIPTIHLWGQIK